MKTKIFRFVAIILAFLALNYFLPLRTLLVDSIDWFHQAGPFGMLVFSLIFIVGSVFFFPVGPLIMAAGSVYGMWTGYFLVAISAALSMSLAYFIGKKFWQEKVEGFRKIYPRFEQLHRAISHKGLLLVFLIRLNPFFPFGLLNYLFTIPHLNFPKYLLCSSAGMFPDILLYLYIGRLGADVLQHHSHFSAWNWAILAIALGATLLAVFIINNVIKKAAAQSAP